jgi:copper resistance protein B
MRAARLASVALLALAMAAGAEEPRTPVPALTDADRAAARMPTAGHEVHDNDIHGYLLLDRLEYSNGERNGLAWNARGWLGTDLGRLWLRTEGARTGGRVGSADTELLYGHSFSTWWDVVGGLRQDFRPGDGLTWAAFGVQGLAPQRFEVTATAYLGEHSRTAARLESEYQLLFTNRLILQPLLDLWLHGKDDAARGTGSGLSTAEIGLRLRYEFTRRCAPYVGVSFERAFGDTASIRRAAGDPVTDTRFVAGLRAWF